MIGGCDGNRVGNPAAARDHREAAVWHGARHLPGMQPRQEEQDRPMPERDVQAGWRGLALLALQLGGGRVL